MARIRRDDSLDRISKVTRVLGIGLLTTTGVLGLYLSKALPGHSSTRQSTTSSTTRKSTAGSSTSGTSSRSGQLSPPANPPAPSRQPATVVSGAS
jgi:hypothetical protein